MEQKKKTRKRKVILQYERGNCKGCEYRIDKGSEGTGVCSFYLWKGKRIRKDRQGNCKENVKLNAKREKGGN